MDSNRVLIQAECDQDPANGGAFGPRAQSILPAALGHRRVGFVNGELWMDAAIDRPTGYK
jgi:hypothetical protein